jgi:hypothetical protein
LRERRFHGVSRRRLQPARVGVLPGGLAMRFVQRLGLGAESKPFAGGHVETLEFQDRRAVHFAQITQCVHREIGHRLTIVLVR